MIRLPPRSTRTDTLFPYTTLFRSAGQGVGDLLGIGDPEIILLAAPDPAPFPEQAFDRPLHGRRLIGRIDRDGDILDLAVPGEAALHRLDRHQHGVVLIAAEAGLAAAGERSDHLAGDVAEAEALAERAFAAEEIVANGGPDAADRAAARSDERRVGKE